MCNFKAPSILASSFGFLVVVSVQAQAAYWDASLTSNVFEKTVDHFVRSYHGGYVIKPQFPADDNNPYVAFGTRDGSSCKAYTHPYPAEVGTLYLVRCDGGTQPQLNALVRPGGKLQGYIRD